MAHNAVRFFPWSYLKDIVFCEKSNNPDELKARM